MKITKKHLQEIIKEELQRVLYDPNNFLKNFDSTANSPAAGKLMLARLLHPSNAQFPTVVVVAVAVVVRGVVVAGFSHENALLHVPSA